MTRSLPAPSRDIALLVARLVIGVVFYAHGWQKLVLNGISDTAVLFHNFGIPLAIVASSFTVCVEFVGGTLLILGVLVPVASAFITFVMLGAIYFVHGSHGIFAADGGWELVAVLIAGVLAIAAFGPGRLSLDHLLHTRKAPAPAPVPIPEPYHPGPFDSIRQR
ncbi:DoxX family protein [Pseudonocardia acidicola]|uniref:DoxX family protein n=1 Tax=Pseudonocardia acidicola TaxID=2724939 RepID=A0ABX1SGY4_9PSEU|nr:DoxX family protein [Pseudonocardia acidicola]NMI00826.1 DoxX family protein [Pseudonocardia acidicola]